VIRTKSVWTAARPGDGLRILVSRFRGRGLRADRYDVWMPSLGPSEELLREFQSGAIDWRAFGTRYRDELFLPGPIDDRSRTIKNHGQKFTLRLLKALGRRATVTLMCQCDEAEAHCHRHLLLKELNRPRL
jgi:uncharacterized protein YeaO (DUF488 family)